MQAILYRFTKIAGRDKTAARATQAAGKSHRKQERKYNERNITQNRPAGAEDRAELEEY